MFAEYPLYCLPALFL